MPLKLMYITNKPNIAQIAESAGVDRIFVDMEYIGKDKRQGGLDTVKNHHTIEDVKRIKQVLKKADLLVRVNPIHKATNAYNSSEEEINNVINAGADIVMLPFFKTLDEIKKFVSFVRERAKVMLLLETPEAANQIDEIVKIDGIDEIHIGINDLSLGYHRNFMFELLTDGTIERLCLSCKQAGIPYGFGGVTAIGGGEVPAEAIIKEHYRIGSSMVILSRTFCKIDEDTDINDVRDLFRTGVRNIRNLEKEIYPYSKYFEDNRRFVEERVALIAEKTEIND